MNLFIDTNIFLSFYHLTSDDLHELRKLLEALEKKDVFLYLPTQVRDEFLRNREAKIADALKRFKEQRIVLQFPQMCKDFEEYEPMRKLQEQHAKLHSSLIHNLQLKIEAHTLEADQLISKLFGAATTVGFSSELFERAKVRVALGNPPGKNGSIGDAVNWEALLAEVPDNEDLFLVSDDKDYASQLNDQLLKEFLVSEWSDRKHSDIRYYRRLSAFFREKYPTIELAHELEKKITIDELGASGCFAETHKIIAELSKYASFTAAECNDIFRGGLSNGQVSWIFSDPDVYEFMKALREGHEGEIEPSLLADVNARLTAAAEEIAEREKDLRS